MIKPAEIASFGTNIFKLPESTTKSSTAERKTEPGPVRPKINVSIPIKVYASNQKLDKDLISPLNRPELKRADSSFSQMFLQKPYEPLKPHPNQFENTGVLTRQKSITRQQSIACMSEYQQSPFHNQDSFKIQSFQFEHQTPINDLFKNRMDLSPHAQNSSNFMRQPSLI